MKESFEELVNIQKRLRKECPWDKKQTFETIKNTLKEEVDEVIEAIEKKDHKNLKEELGDLMINLVFLVNIAEEKKLFTFKEVLQGTIEKLIRRHPHIFGEAKADTPEEVLKIWKEAKEAEKND
ncbi:MAG: MazG nucleotide pyrophosphohydrolase domain-containing protein [Nanoarchaeota archaeon]|nr:MazG nucleotide pyrophosphohydrolase domain-containing protein [Nanoarchaeota archaeon]